MTVACPSLMAMVPSWRKYEARVCARRCSRHDGGAARCSGSGESQSPDFSAHARTRLSRRYSSRGHPPLFANSVTAEALRNDIGASLIHRGYLRSTRDAQILVVYHVALPAKEDVTDWESEDAWRPLWARDSAEGGVNLRPREYVEGGLVVDLLDARTGAVLWRGHGVTAAPDDVRLYARDLKRTVSAILADVPEPSGLLAWRTAQRAAR